MQRVLLMGAPCLYESGACQLNLEQYLYAGIYLSKCRFANIEDFVAAVGNVADLTLEVSQSDAADSLCEVVDRLRDSKLDPAKYESLCLAGDLAMISDALSGHPGIEDPVDTIDALSTAVARGYADIDLAVEEIPLRIVDEFPPPFDKFGWAAFTPDGEDISRFDIEPGVYFRKDRVRPFYTPVIYAHEMLHGMTGRVDPTVYAMGLEEGIAEVLGTVYVGSRVASWDVIQQILVHHRLGSGRAVLWSQYRDHTRQARLLGRSRGLPYLAGLVRQGRSSIHEAEAQLINPSQFAYRQVHEAWPEDVERCLATCFDALPTSFLLSTTERYLLPFIQVGREIDSICREAAIGQEIGEELVRSLGARTALFVCGETKVEYSNVERYLAMELMGQIPFLRYELSI